MGLGLGPPASDKMPELTSSGRRCWSDEPNPTKEDVGKELWRGGTLVGPRGCTTSEWPVMVDLANVEDVSGGSIDSVVTISVEGLKNFQAGGSMAWGKMR